MYLDLSDELKRVIPDGCDPFVWLLEGHGVTHRHVKNRLTYEQSLGDLHFFVKRHLGCGWNEVFKEWYRFRKPVVSARTEWEGAESLCKAGIRVPKVLGKGERGSYPHAIESFVVLEALEDCDTLEHFKEGWHDYTGVNWVRLKRDLITEVATISRKMHAKGINHRDFYLNHFLLNRKHIKNWSPRTEIQLNLIDLHRVQQRSSVPRRWLIKDLGSLIFSALDVGLTSSDAARFLKIYLGPNWKQLLCNDLSLWQSIMKRAVKLYVGFHGTRPKLPKLLTT
ncbi:MAG TPA: lipopolysaccharide core heptose(I) kinase RfaP [Opitutae bacterium]|mgnify:CR=1 FL=1|nr:lipopolysaccharide core heptose(I) kinase RfaP [Opitutae bacterium]